MENPAFIDGLPIKTEAIFEIAKAGSLAFFGKPAQPGEDCFVWSCGNHQRSRIRLKGSCRAININQCSSIYVLHFMFFNRTWSKAAVGRVPLSDVRAKLCILSAVIHLHGWKLLWSNYQAIGCSSSPFDSSWPCIYIYIYIHLYIGCVSPWILASMPSIFGLYWWLTMTNYHTINRS